MCYKLPVLQVASHDIPTVFLTFLSFKQQWNNSKPHCKQADARTHARSKPVHVGNVESTDPSPQEADFCQYYKSQACIRKKGRRVHGRIGRARKHAIGTVQADAWNNSDVRTRANEGTSRAHGPTYASNCRIRRASTPCKKMGKRARANRHRRGQLFTFPITYPFVLSWKGTKPLATFISHLGEDLLPFLLVAESVPPEQVGLELQAALLQGVLDGLLDLLRIVSNVLLACALRCNRHRQRSSGGGGFRGGNHICRLKHWQTSGDIRGFATVAFLNADPASSEVLSSGQDCERTAVDFPLERSQ